MTENETQENKPLPSIFDRYEGREVMVQLKSGYYPTTHPGVPHHTYVPLDPEQPCPAPEQVDPSKPLEEQNLRPAPYKLPMITGLCELDRDAHGNVLVVIVRHDPNIQKDNMVEVGFSPDAIFSISAATEESRILAGS